MSSRYKKLFGLLLVAFTVACGGRKDSAEQWSAGASVLGGACDESDLDDPTVCAGPWQYAKRASGTCYADIQATDCPLINGATCSAYGSHQEVADSKTSMSTFFTTAHSAYGQPTTYTWAYNVIQSNSTVEEPLTCSVIYTSPDTSVSGPTVGACAGEGVSYPTIQKAETTRLGTSSGYITSAVVGTQTCKIYCDSNYRAGGYFWDPNKQMSGATTKGACCVTTGGGYGEPPPKTTCVAPYTVMATNNATVCNYAATKYQTVYSPNDPQVPDLQCSNPTATWATRHCDCDTNALKHISCVTNAHPVVDCPVVVAPDGSPVAYWTPEFGRDLAYVKSLPQSAANTITPTCLTGDVAPALTAVDRYSRLTQTLQVLPQYIADTGARAQLRAIAVGKLKLLLELHSPELSDDVQRSYIRQLYVSDPQAARGCGDQIPWTPPADTSGCGNVATINAHMTRCSRLLMSHVSPETAAIEAEACVADLNADLNAQPAQCTAYTPGFEQLSTDLLRKAFQRMLLDDEGTAKQAARRTELKRRLGIINTWYGALSQRVADPETLARDMDTVTASFVQGAYSWKLQVLDAAATLGQVEQTLRSGPDVPRELAMVAFPPDGSAAPLTSAPLVYLVADILREPSERLDQTGYLHDLGCRFQNCVQRDPNGVPTGTLSTPVVQMHGLLAALPVEADLLSAYNASVGVNQGWRDVFSYIQGRHSVLRSAIASAAGKIYTPALLTDSLVPVIPVADLRAIVQRSAMKLAWYARTGRLRAGDEDAVNKPLLNYKLDDALAIEVGVRNRLYDQLSNYRTNVTALIDTQLTKMSTVQALADAQAELDTKRLTAQALAGDLDVLRTAMNVDAAMLGHFSNDYEAAIARLQGTGAQWMATTTAVFTVRPPDAVNTVGYSGGVITDVGSFAASGPQGNQVRVAAGDLVNVTVDGAYSPTCALRRAHADVADPVDEAVNATGSSYGALHQWYRASPELWPRVGALTGPQGFVIGYSDGHWTSDSTSKTPTSGEQALGTGMQAVGGAMSNAPNPWVAGAGMVLNVAGGIVSTFTGRETVTHGTERRDTMSYSVGLRLENTPFRQAPAGALLVVRTKPNDHSYQGILDVSVAQMPSTTLVVDQASDVFVVVNDQQCLVEAGEGDRGSLSVQVRRLASVGGFAQIVQPRLAQALASVDAAAAAKFTNQGTLLPTDLASLRSSAMAWVTTSCPQCAAPEFAPIMQFFTSVLDTRLTQIERTVEIRRLERQLEHVLIEWGALATKVVNVGRQNQALILREAWTARGIDARLLRDETVNLVTTLDRDLYPFMRAKYPESITGWPGYGSLMGASTFTNLTSYDWAMSWANLADRAIQAADVIHDRVHYAKLDFQSQFLDSDPGLPVVTIAIPKPVDFLDDPIDGFLYMPMYRELPNSREVWSAIRANEPARIVLSPELLYTPDDPLAPQYPYQLSCLDSLPVITAVGLQVLNNSTTDNLIWQGRQVTFHADPAQTFIGVSGPVKFINTNASWLSFSVPLQYTASMTDPMLPGGGEGISPTATFVLDPKMVWLDPAMTGLPDRRAASALLLRLKMERRRMGVKPSWFPTTQSPSCH